jgi:hypothetical protein
VTPACGQGLQQRRQSRYCIVAAQLFLGTVDYEGMISLIVAINTGNCGPKGPLNTRIWLLNVLVIPTYVKKSEQTHQSFLVSAFQFPDLI